MRFLQRLHVGRCGKAVRLLDDRGINMKPKYVRDHNRNYSPLHVLFCTIVFWVSVGIAVYAWGSGIPEVYTLVKGCATGSIECPSRIAE